MIIEIQKITLLKYVRIMSMMLGICVYIKMIMMDGIMKTWNEPDIFESNQPNSLQRFNELWRLRREQYDYDETKLIDVKPIVDKLNDTGIVVLKDVVDKKLLQKVRDDA